MPNPYVTRQMMRVENQLRDKDVERYQLMNLAQREAPREHLPNRRLAAWLFSFLMLIKN
jgi:hypothetical protein